MKTNQTRKTFALISAIIILSFTAQAQGIKIANTTLKASGDVNIVVKDGGFTNNGTFAKDAETVKFTGTTAANLDGSSATDFNNLQVGNTGGISLSGTGAVSVANLLALEQGVFYLGNYELTLGTAATATVTSPPLSWVDATGSGRFIKQFSTNQSFAFPVGNGGGTPAYSPVILNLSAGGYSSAWIGVKLKNEVHPNNPHALPNYPNYLKRYWDIASGGLTSPSYNATFNYVQSDVAGAEDSLLAARRYGSSSNWQRFSAVNLAGNYFTINGLNSFSEFTAVQSFRPPRSLALTGPASVIASAESGNFTIQVFDTYGDSTIVRENTQFALSTTSTGTTRVFNPISPVSIANARGSTNFTYKDSQVGNPTVTATRSAGDVGLVGKSDPHSILVKLPTPWNDPCVIGNSYGLTQYFPTSANGDFFELTSKGYASSTSDIYEFVNQPLNGDGYIKARVNSITGDGWAGLQLRESCVAGAKKVVFKTQLYKPEVISEYRSVTNGQTLSRQYLINSGIKWFKLQRAGNNFTGYTSPDGVVWKAIFTLYNSMSANLQAGIFTEGNKYNQTDVAQFDHVSVGTSTKESDFINQPPANETASSLNVNIFPNPATEKITVSIPENDGRAKLSVASLEGQLLITNEFSGSEMQLDISSLQPGVYLVRIDVDGEVVVKRLVVL